MTASGCTRARGETSAEGSMGIPSYHTEVTVAELAQLLQCPFEGEGERVLNGAASLDDASEDELSFVGNRKGALAAANSRAGCLIVPESFDAGGRTVIRSPQPRNHFARALFLLFPDPQTGPSIHPTAIIASSAKVDPSCTIGPLVVIDDAVVIGPGTRIAAGCYIGPGSQIGANCRLHPNVTIYSQVELGDRCILHAGSILGADGFGFAFEGDHWEKFPQVGGVRIGNDVEIGAGTCIDRAALGWTTIGDGTKLDNLVHIAHNCAIGRHVVIAAQTGLSGGVTVGDYAVIGGQVGIGDKARIESRAVLGSGCGILTSKIVKGGQVVWGTPARPLKEHLRNLAYIDKLEDTLATIKRLEQRVADLEGKQP
jgi:UDP-3-O-[3-hydroxymyristoyl] glucosamine N-acyltransferase